jgi:hypothetical protein
MMTVMYHEKRRNINTFVHHKIEMPFHFRHERALNFNIAIDSADATPKKY